MPDRQIWMSGPLTGGRNTRDARGQIEPIQSPDDLNVEWTEFGSLTRRNGFRRVIPDEFGDGARGAMIYKNKIDGRYLIYQADDKLVSYKVDEDSYFDRQELYSGLSVVERFFIQSNEWAYMNSFDDAGPTGQGDGPDKSKRWNRRWVRRQNDDQTKPEIEGALRNMGLRGLWGSAVTCVPSNGSGGLAFTGTGSPEYYYRFAYQYYELGESRYVLWDDSGAGEVAGSAGDDTVTITFTDTTTGPQHGPTDAKEIRIYRTQQASTGATVDGPYYFIGVAQPGSVYVDTAPDSDLSEPAPLQPLFNDYMLPLFKHMFLHQNRAFFLNVVEATDQESEYNVLEVEAFPHRLYYSDLYQPDRWMGLIDMTTTAPLVAGCSFYDQAVLFQPNRTLVLTGTGPSNFNLRTVDGKKGCVAPRSIDILENHVIFLSGEGYCAYNGATVKRISEAIRNDLIGLSNSRMALACGATHKGAYRASIVQVD